jgi:fermentation-respiration switch protein FrsA (DUF1100 family)
VEFPGYGIYQGSPSEKNIYEDALAVYDFFKMKFKPHNIMVCGRSIGAGPAIFLAGRRQVSCLISISAFTSLKEVVSDRVGFFSFLLKEQFLNSSLIDQVICPTLFIHGKNDTMVPSSHSEELFKECRAKKAIVVHEEMTHDFYLYKLHVVSPAKKFFEKHKLMPGAKQSLNIFQKLGTRQNSP